MFSSFYDVVCVCEIWLNDFILSSEIFLGYIIYCCDCLIWIGGGVLVVVKDNIRLICYVEFELENIEFIVIEFIILSSKFVFFYIFYCFLNLVFDVFF